MSEENTVLHACETIGRYLGWYKYSIHNINGERVYKWNDEQGFQTDILIFSVSLDRLSSAWELLEYVPYLLFSEDKKSFACLFPHMPIDRGLCGGISWAEAGALATAKAIKEIKEGV